MRSSKGILIVLFAALSVNLFAQSAAVPTDLPQLNHFDASIVDRSLDPCNDFYKYVCSKWEASHPIPADQPAWGTSSNLQIWNEGVLRNTMMAVANPDSKRSAVEQKIGDYWYACMDESGIEKTGLTALQPDLDRINGIKNKGELAAVIAHIHMTQYGAWNADDNETQAAMFGFGQSQDLNDSSLVVASVDQGGMALPGRDYYVSDNPKLTETRNKYQEHVRKMFVLAGESADKAKADADTVLRIETAMAKVAMENVKRRDPKNLNNPMSLEKLQALTPSFHWNEYLKLVGAPTPKHYLVTSPDFFRGLEPLIQGESLDNWKTYLKWWTLHNNAAYLNKAFVDENFDFFGRTLVGSQELRPRWRRCVRSADRDLGEALGQAYVEKAFPPSSKQRMQEMLKAIREALSQDIDQLDWMTPETKKNAKVKLAAMEEKIGYPSQWRDYSSVKITRDSWVKNVSAASNFEFHRQLKKINEPVDRMEWGMTPPTIDAYNDGQLNTINFPAGILQPPFFDPQADDAANYGAIGAIIGHEITHGFDDQGRKFDANGNLRDWWTGKDAQEYEQRGKCISDEYTGEIPELGVKQNGLMTQGEDTADNGGLRIAFMALENTYKKEGKSLDDKGPDGFTARQRFFLAHGYEWCQAWRPELARTVVTTNPHSMPRLRVDNVESNMPEFREAFGCKQGQPMVRAQACRVW